MQNPRRNRGRLVSREPPSPTVNPIRYQWFFRYDDSDNPFDLLVVLGRCVLRLRDIVWTNPGRIALQELFSEPGSSALTLRDIDEALSARKETPPAYYPQAFLESGGSYTMQWTGSVGTSQIGTFPKSELEGTSAGRILMAEAKQRRHKPTIRRKASR